MRKRQRIEPYVALDAAVLKSQLTEHPELDRSGPWMTEHETIPQRAREYHRLLTGSALERAVRVVGRVASLHFHGGREGDRRPEGSDPRVPEGRTVGTCEPHPDALWRIDGPSAPPRARFKAIPVWDSAGQVTDRRSA
jgi:hypothetical protein